MPVFAITNDVPVPPQDNGVGGSVNGYMGRCAYRKETVGDVTEFENVNS